MKGRIKNIATAWLCVLTLVVGCFSGISFVSKATDGTETTEYTEYTFSDAGIKDGLYINAGAGTLPIESWDKVAFVGNIELGTGKGTDGETYARLCIGDGTLDNGNIRITYGWGSLIFRYYNDAGAGQTMQIKDSDVESAGITLTGKIELCMGFNVVNEDLNMTVTVTSEDKSYTAPVFTYTGVGNTLGKTVTVLSKNEGYPIAISSAEIVREEEVVVEKYKEYTFSDANIDNGQYTTATKGTLPIESWDKVAFVGNVTMIGGETDVTYLYIGEGTQSTKDISISHRYGTLCIEGMVSTWTITSGTAGVNFRSEFELRLEFDVEGEDLKITITVTQGEISYTQSKIFTGIANTLGKVVTVYSKDSSQPFVISSAEIEREEEDPVVYTEYTFTNAGIKDGSYVSATKGALPIESWDKVALVGNVTFVGGTEGTTWLYLGEGTQGSKDIQISHRYGQLCFEGLVSFWSITSSEAGFALTNEMQLRLQFDVVDEDLKMTVTLTSGNNSYTKATTFAGIANTLGKMVTVYSKSEENPFAISSIEIDAGTVVQDSTSYNLRGHDHATVQNYFVAGDAVVTKDGETYAVNNQVISEPGNYTISIKSVADNRTYVKDVALYILGDVDLNGVAGEDGDITALESLVKTNTYEVESAAEYAADLDNDGKVGSKDLALMESMIEANVDGYTVYTFSDVGLSDGSYVSAKKGILPVTSWDKFALVGNMTFVGEEVGKTFLYIGEGTQGSKDIQISHRYGQLCFEGMVPFWSITNNTSGINPRNEIELVLKFDVDGEDLKMTVTMTQGDISYTADTKTFTGIANSLGKMVTVYSNDSTKPFRISSKYTLQDVLDKYHVPAQTYEYLGGNEVMPITGYYGPYSSYITDDIFRAIKDSGVNLINFTPWDAGSYGNDTRKALAMAEKYGLGWFVEDYTLNPKVDVANNHEIDADAEMLTNEQLASRLRWYAYSTAFLGVHIEDEPSYNGADEKQDYRLLDYYLDSSAQLNSFANITGYINLVAEDARTVNNYYSDQFAIKQTDLYDEYWEQYTANSKAQVYSSDDYPIANGVNEDVTDAVGYFRTLGKTRNESLEHSTPFWSHVQAGGDFNSDEATTNESYMPSKAETFWNVNTALAFGAKGISWFPLIQPSIMDGITDLTTEASVDRNGLILSDGTKSTYYKWAQEANAQIAAVDEVLMKATSTAIVASGGYAASEATGEVDTVTTEVQTSHGKLSSVTSTNTTYGALVGCFDYRDTEAFYVVNYNVEGTDAQTITLTLNGTFDYRCIAGAKETYGTTTENQINISLAPGKGALIVLEDRSVVYDVADIQANCEPDAEPGYLFSGWFSDADCTKAKQITDISSYTEETVYAKFVDDGVLGVKAQLNADADKNDDTISMRFVTSVDSLDYKTMGFKIVKKVNPAVTRTIESTKVYETLLAKYGGAAKVFAVKDVFSPMSTYFQAYAIWNIPSEAYGVEYEVTPYWITLDGTTVYGQPVIKSVNMGLETLSGR